METSVIGVVVYPWRLASLYKSKSVERSKSIPPKSGAPVLVSGAGFRGMVGAEQRSALVDAGQSGAVGGPSGTASPLACPLGVPSISADHRMLGQLMVEKFMAPCADPVSPETNRDDDYMDGSGGSGVSGGTIRVLALYVCRGRI